MSAYLKTKREIQLKENIAHTTVQTKENVDDLE